MRFLGIPALLLVCLFQAGCDDAVPNSDQKQARQQEVMRQQATAQTGMPSITNFTEMKLMRQLYELRDKEIATYAYVPDYQGRLWYLCDSIGYGLPYGTQYSNPERHTNIGGAENPGYNMPQAEPNGLFMPPSAEGTWVVCGTAHDLKPVYVEPRVIISPFKLRAEGEWAMGGKQ